MRHSKLQKEILRVYRSLLRAAKTVPGLQDHVRLEFQKYTRSVDKKHTLQAEYLLRRAQKQLKNINQIERVTDLRK